MEKTPTGNWYKTLMSKTNELAEQLGLDDFGTSTLREFIVSTAKAQYCAGNKSGIRWARSNPSPSQG